MTPARRRVLAHYTADAARFGVSPTEVAAYAHAMADTLEGRRLEVGYAVDDLTAAVTARVNALAVPLGRLILRATGRR